MSDDKFQNKYRIPSARAQWWNYGNDGAYFITICTANRECLFGNIVDSTMILSSIGEIVNREWNKSFEIRKELFCDIYVIMPNHIHAVVRIEHVETYDDVGTQGINDVGIQDVGTHNVGTHDVGTHDVETHGRASLRQQRQHPISGIAYRPPKSISSFIAGFKSSTTKQINGLRNTPKCAVWQTRCHDHIIRNSDEYWRITNYIINNPQKWKEDKFYME
jgi:REP element-mobilizing transposase RayT